MSFGKYNEGYEMKECSHQWVDNIPVRNNAQDGYAGQHCTKCYKERGYALWINAKVSATDIQKVDQRNYHLLHTQDVESVIIGTKNVIIDVLAVE